MTDDKVIWRAQLQAHLDVSSETIRRWMSNGRLPKPDVDLSRRSRGWRRSTLQRAGILGQAGVEPVGPGL